MGTESKSAESRPEASLAMSTNRQGEIIATGTVGPAGHATSAIKNEDGTVTYGSQGKPPQHEDGALSACSTLVQVLNSTGSTWEQPAPIDGDDDCECTDRNDLEKKLRIQVTRGS